MNEYIIHEYNFSRFVYVYSNLSQWMDSVTYGEFTIALKEINVKKF